MTLEFTAKEFVEKTIEIIEREPEWAYVNPDGQLSSAEYPVICLYGHGKAGPGCIFGRVFHELGANTGQLDTLNTLGTIRTVLDALHVRGAAGLRISDITPGLFRWAGELQRLQDAGETVGVALQRANEAQPSAVVEALSSE